ncbi:prepilin peptidase [Candidatus Sumerlaeota bacterium]|nr:prepilin peptidase [Candidatus Sumerlaeota bacterium]
MSELIAPEFFPIHAAFFFAIGAFFGSFFNVCIYRLPAGQSLSFPRSYCYSCGTTIPWHDNVPVLSYFLLGGRCRVCRAPYSARYMLIELLTGFLFLGVFLQYRFAWVVPVYLVFTGLLLISTFTDIDNWVILDRVSLGGAAAGIALALVLVFLPPVDPARWIVAHAGPAPATAWWGPVANSVVGALAGASLLWIVGFIGSIVFRKPAMGFGDVKLLALIGAFTGWKIALLSIFVGSLLGSVYGLTALALDRLRSERAARVTTDESREMLSEIETILGVAPESEDQGQRSFSDREKAVLTRILSTPKARGARARHHLPFGPHLATAAWLLMVFEPRVMREIERFLGPTYF